ncbi:transposable element Tcb1 transposase [Trichonephila clavipes]|nr:transposable element Tcb1 transposase [Trichonephila clavipes]
MGILHQPHPKLTCSRRKSCYAVRETRWIAQSHHEPYHSILASVSERTIRHHLQQNGMYARRALLGLPLTQNHRRLRRQWCDERRMWVAEWNEVVFTDELRICLQHHGFESGDTVE